LTIRSIRLAVCFTRFDRAAVPTGAVVGLMAVGAIQVSGGGGMPIVSMNSSTGIPRDLLLKDAW
jgi:hypothetical protein